MLASHAVRWAAPNTVAALILLVQPPLAAETLFSGYTGTSYTRNSDLRLTQPSLATDLTLHGVRLHALQDLCEDRSGRCRRRYGAGFTRRGHGADGPVGAALRDFARRERAQPQRHLPLLRFTACRRLRPYLGAGLAYYVPHAENTVGGVSFESGCRSSGFGYQLFAGAQYRMTEHVAFAETKFNSGTAKVDIAGGRAETPLRAFHVLGGVSYRFEEAPPCETAALSC